MEPRTSPFPQDRLAGDPAESEFGLQPAACDVGDTTRSDDATDDSLVDAARRKLGEAGQAARQQAHELADQATEALQSARRSGEEAIQQQKSRISEQVSRYGSVMRGVAGKFRDEGNAGIAGYAEQTADQLDRLAGYLSWRDMGGLLDDAQQSARRHPEVFFGSMFVAGLALSRFLKASRPQRLGSENRNLMPTGQPSGGAHWQRAEMVETSRPFEDPGVAAPVVHTQEAALAPSGAASIPSPYGA
jgi:hypothetical protein